MGSSFKAPLSHSIVYETRRHWFEVVPEIGDAVFWCLIISLNTLALMHKLDYPRIVALLGLNLFPLGFLFKELFFWNTEWFIIAQTPQGKRKLFKSNIVKFPLLGVVSEEGFSDYIDMVTVDKKRGWLGVQFGFWRVVIRSAREGSYTDGRLAPERLVSIIESGQNKPSTIPEDAPGKEIAMRSVAQWVEQGIADVDRAKMVVNHWLSETL